MDKPKRNGNTMIWLMMGTITFFMIFHIATSADRNKLMYDKGYNAGLDTVIKIMDVQLRADTNTCTNIIFDDTLVYELYRKPEFRHLKSN